MSLRGCAAVVGIAETPPQRWSEDITTLELWSGVAVDAIADAGLERTSVDGLISTPIGGIPGMIPATLSEFLGLRPRYAEVVDIGGASAAGMVWRAAAAIQAGMCNTCLCLTGALRRKKPPSSDPFDSQSLADRAPLAQFDYPYGMIGANVGYGMLATLYADEYGVTDEQRAKVAVDQRKNANANPDAIFYEKSLVLDDVLQSAVISSPLRLLEIVMQTAGAAAIVVTSADRAVDTRHRPAWLLGAGECVTHSSMAQIPALGDTGTRIAARNAFDQAGVQPSDIHMASVYDCYTIMVMHTLEEAGFCGRGEAGAFVESHDLTYGGSFPINTHGGQLSFGQSGMAGGMSHVTEAVRQIRASAAERQVPDLELVYVHGNGGVVSEQTALILGANF